MPINSPQHIHVERCETTCTCQRGGFILLSSLHLTCL